jgi:hypothetical protein
MPLLQPRNFLDNRPRRPENATHQSGSDREIEQRCGRPCAEGLRLGLRPSRREPPARVVDVAPDGVSVTQHAAGIRSFVAELTSDNDESGHDL